MNCIARRVRLLELIPDGSAPDGLEKVAFGARPHTRIGSKVALFGKNAVLGATERGIASPLTGGETLGSPDALLPMVNRSPRSLRADRRPSNVNRKTHTIL